MKPTREELEEETRRLMAGIEEMVNLPWFLPRWRPWRRKQAAADTARSGKL